MVPHTSWPGIAGAWRTGDRVSDRASQGRGVDFDNEERGMGKGGWGRMRGIVAER